MVGDAPETGQVFALAAEAGEARLQWPAEELAASRSNKDLFLTAFCIGFGFGLSHYAKCSDAPLQHQTKSDLVWLPKADATP